jgi:hypothetical protein
MNESFNSLIPLYAPKGVYWSQMYEFSVNLTVLHYNEGEQFRIDLKEKLMKGVQQPYSVANLPETELNMQISTTDIPANVVRRKQKIKQLKKQQV